MALFSKSHLNGNKEYKYEEEKRCFTRIKFDLEVLYPRINNESIHEKYGLEGAVLKAINISETGICFKSVLKLNEGDFLNFSLKLKEGPSFWCLARVKWLNFDDNTYIVGCEFISLTLQQINDIREFVNTNVNA